MINSFEMQGTWWIPPNNDNTSTGILKYSPEKGCELTDVVGTMIPLVGPLPALGAGPILIQGISHSGRRFTCVNAQISGHRINHPGNHVSQLDIQKVFEGHFFATIDAIRLRRMRFNYSNLHKWLFEHRPIAVQHNGPVTTVTYLREVLWMINWKELAIQHSFTWSSSQPDDPTPNFTFTHTDGLLITSNEPVSPEVFYEAEAKFRSLINLLGECQLQVAEIQGDLGIQNADIKIYDRPRFHFNERVDPPFMNSPLRYSEAEGHFADLLMSWFALYDELKSVVNLYLFAKQNWHREIQNGFLGMLQAAEGYHRVFGEGQYMTKQDYDGNVKQQLTNAIPNDLSDAFKSKLRSMFRWAYEYSLRKKLEELIGILPATPTFDAVRNPAFIGSTVDTRNYFTHRDEASAHLALTGIDLIRATLRWEEVILALLMKRLGLADDLLDRAVRRLQESRTVGEYL